MAARRRASASRKPVCDMLETRLVLSGNSLSHAFDSLGHDITRLTNQIGHIGQHHNNQHNVGLGGLHNPAVHYHHIIK